MDRRRGWRIGLLFALIWAVGLLIVWIATSKRDSETTPPTPTTPSSATGAAPAPAEQSATSPVAVTKTVVASPADETSSRKFGTLRGRVFDAISNEPVREFEIRFPGILVTEQKIQTPSPRKFRSDDGRFEWSNLPPARWAVSTKARGYQQFLLEPVEILPGKTTEIPIPLRRGLALRGRVFDESTGMGIASATLAFRESEESRLGGGWELRDRVQTGKEGAFVIDGVPPGRVVLTIDAGGYAGEERDVLVERAGFLEIPMSAGATISGRLTTADGATGIAGRVQLMNLDFGSGMGNPTSETGDFSYAQLSPGRYAVKGEAEGSATEPHEILLAKNARVEGLVLALKTGRSIRGVVTGLSPEQREALRVQLRRKGARVTDVGVDEQGTYAFHGVQPGRVQLVATVSTSREVWRTVTVPPDADVKVDFSFVEGVRLSGRVTRSGRPVPELWIEALAAEARPMSSGTAMTSQSGEYAIEGLVAGEYRINAGYQRVQYVRLSADTVLDIDVPDTQLSGRILEARDELPLVGANVDIWTPGAIGPSFQQQTNHYGEFSFVGVAAGELLLTAYKPGYEMQQQKIAFNGSLSDVTLKLQPEQGVSIRAHDASTGRALRSLFVEQRTSGGVGYTLSVNLDTDGIGRLPAALSGSHLTISAWGYAAKELNAWDGLPLDLQFTRAD
jgi:hypothetical protein